MAPSKSPLPLFSTLLSCNPEWRRLCPRGYYVRRRDFIKVIACSAAAWPLAVRAQQTGTKRIGVLAPIAAEDPLFQAREAAFFQGLQQVGWIDGRNAQIDIRHWSTGEADEIRRYAAELVALAPRRHPRCRQRDVGSVVARDPCHSNRVHCGP